jgi:hypothetical protein
MLNRFTYDKTLDNTYFHFTCIHNHCTNKNAFN